MTLPARLLLVDDDESNRDLLARRLLRSGYSADLAEDGERALEMVKSRPYDLVLLDHMMPGISGLEVLQNIRQKWSASELPVIMVTALGETKNVVDALGMGANDYITKPIDFAVALARIEMRLRLSLSDRELRRANELYQLASRASDEGLWDWNVGTVGTGNIYYSSRWKSMLGLAGEISASPEEWFGRIHRDDRQRVCEEVQSHLHGRADGLKSEYRMRHTDGRYRWIETSGNVSRDASGRVIRMAGCQTDITARKTLDPETSLPNRTWLETELDSLAADGRSSALLLVDLDDFDRIEGRLDHEASKRLLAAAAGRLRELAGPAGGEAVRSGDHQFGVLLKEVASHGAAAELADRLTAALAEPFRIDEQPVWVTAIAGAIMLEPGASGSALLRKADAALRLTREEKSGHGDGSGDFPGGAEPDLEQELRGGLERSEFVVHYQPKVNLEDGLIAGYEALVRWNRPGHGLVMPNDFIRTAERRGLIGALGRFVLERACRDTADLRRSFPWLKVSVNVSGRQFEEPDLVEQVRECLRAAGLEASALNLEITETFLVKDADQALAMLGRLRAMGVGLKLDDFGSGYSSLDYLQKFPFDTLKIDRSFVSRLASSRESVEIVRAIVGLARSLNMKVVAEGIEDPAQIAWLREMGCHYGQGYWFSRPVELRRLKELLDERGGGIPNGLEAPACLAHLLQFATQSGGNLLIPHKAMPRAAKS